MCTQYRTAFCNTIFLSTVLNVHVPEFQIYEEDTAFIYNNVQLCALKISVLITDYMFKVKYMYENSNFILYQRVMIVPESSKVKQKKLHETQTLHLFVFIRCLVEIHMYMYNVCAVLPIVITNF